MFYHGSPVGGLETLMPAHSEHGKAYVYFAADPCVALLYAVKPVPRPFSFYPYGFDAGRRVVYSEYYPNAFYDLYHGRCGYLYECAELPQAQQPTQIYCAYTTESPVRPSRVQKIEDLHAWFMAQKNAFVLKPYVDIPPKELAMAHEELRRNMADHALKMQPEHPMSLFIRKNFPEVWKSVL